MATARYLGMDLAWREASASLPANETGVAAIDSRGQILDAGWRCGVDDAVAWADAVAGVGAAVMFVDAPLVVRNETGQRLCETQVGRLNWATTPNGRAISAGHDGFRWPSGGVSAPRTATRSSTASAGWRPRTRRCGCGPIRSPGSLPTSPRPPMTPPTSTAKI